MVEAQSIARILGPLDFDSYLCAARVWGFKGLAQKVSQTACEISSFDNWHQGLPRFQNHAHSETNQAHEDRATQRVRIAVE